jgi:uncharacterized protein YaiI (UPF0178 family)
MKIWIDADACPRDVRAVIVRAVQRLEVPCVLVANRWMEPPAGELFSAVVVSKGLDEADSWIITHVSPGEVVVTADIPLAAQIVERGAWGINPRGEVYTEENVRERLSMRDFMHGLREAGVQTGGPAPFSAKDTQRFAAGFDRLMTKLLRGGA